MIGQTDWAGQTHSPIRPTTQRVLNRICSLAEAIDDQNYVSGNGILANTLVLPEASIVLAGTNCRTPLLSLEVTEIAELTGLDVILLRFDVDKGARFDVFLTQPDRVLREYVAWHTCRGGQWLIPSDGVGAWLLASRNGIEIRHQPSFVSSEARIAGIKRMMDSPLLAGRN